MREVDRPQEVVLQISRERAHRLVLGCGCRGAIGSKRLLGADDELLRFGNQSVLDFKADGQGDRFPSPKSTFLPAVPIKHLLGFPHRGHKFISALSPCWPKAFSSYNYSVSVNQQSRQKKSVGSAVHSIASMYWSMYFQTGPVTVAEQPV